MRGLPGRGVCAVAFREGRFFCAACRGRLDVGEWVDCLGTCVGLLGKELLGWWIICR